jgi:hypothetical protein
MRWPIEKTILLLMAIAVDLIRPVEGLFSALAPKLPGVEGRAIRAGDASDDVAINRQRAGVDEGAIERDAGSRTGLRSPSDAVVIYMPASHVGHLIFTSQQTR